MYNKQKLVPAARKFGLALTAATAIVSTITGAAQAQYGYNYPAYGYYTELNRYNVPAEQHQFYDRGNTDFNS